MVEFYGERSNESRIKFAKKQSRMVGLCLLGVTIVGLALTLVFGILGDDYYKELLIWSGILGVITIIIFCASKIPQRVLDSKILNRITIGNGIITFIAYQGIEVKKVRSIMKVKKVVDMGAEYHIEFKMLNTWICEKQLLTKGTLEDFEKLFESKIIKVR